MGSNLNDATYYYYLHPNEYTQELHYYSFSVKLNRCVAILLKIFMTKKGCVPNKT